MTNEQEHKQVNIGQLIRPVPPIREHFNPEELAHLIASIRSNGILVPLMVRPIGDKYEVIDGDRRLAAAWEAGLREVPVLVRNLDDRETLIQRMLANKERADTDPVSDAKYIAHLIGTKQMTAGEIAEAWGHTLDWVADRLGIAEMPEYMQVALRNEHLPLGVCLELNQIIDDKTKERYFSEAVRDGMTVRAAKYNRMVVNEALEALRARGEEPTEETIPIMSQVPRAVCFITGEILPVTETRMVRVGIRAAEEFVKRVHQQIP